MTQPNPFEDRPSPYQPSGPYNPLGKKTVPTTAPPADPVKKSKKESVRKGKSSTKKKTNSTKKKTSTKRKSPPSGSAKETSATPVGTLVRDSPLVDSQAEVADPVPLDSVPPGSLGCKRHSVHSTKLHSYNDSKDLKHYFDCNKGFLYGDQCHSGCNWPPSTDASLAKLVNHKSIYYCNQCNLDYYNGQAGDGDKPYFVCEDCYHLKMPQQRKRIRKKR
jgi:hypothetical protein